jgi:hypothetical protein
MNRGPFWDELTAAEQAAVRKLARALRDWPPTMGLYGWSGSLYVVLLDYEEDAAGGCVSVAEFEGVDGDGGDCGMYDGPVTRRGSG